jgi:glycosyltransferase involved in cell wall biosynthesis
LSSIDGIVCENIEEMILKTEELINNDDYANEISIKQRNLAIQLFGKNKIQKQWEDFLNEI